MPTILIVDDSPDFLASAAAMLNDEGFDVVACVSDATRALAEYTGVPDAAAKERRLARAGWAWLVMIGQREREHLQRAVDDFNAPAADRDIETVTGDLSDEPAGPPNS